MLRTAKLENTPSSTQAFLFLVPPSYLHCPLSAVHKLDHLFASVGDNWSERNNGCTRCNCTRSWSTGSWSGRSRSGRSWTYRSWCCSSWTYRSWSTRGPIWGSTRCCTRSGRDDDDRGGAQAFLFYTGLQSGCGCDKSGLPDPVGTSVGGNGWQLWAPAKIAPTGGRLHICTKIQCSAWLSRDPWFFIWGTNQEGGTPLRWPAGSLDV